MNQFPLFIKYDNAMSMMLSPNKSIQVWASDEVTDIYSLIRHVNYESGLTTTDFDEYIAGRVQIITYEKFLDQYNRVQAELRNMINIARPVEMDHTHLITNKNENQ